MFDNVSVIGRGRVGSFGRRRSAGGAGASPCATTPSSCSSASRPRDCGRPRARCGRPVDSRTFPARRRSRTLDPHPQRSRVHPLQTFTHARGPEQLDGAWRRSSRRTTTHGRAALARRDARPAALRARRRRASGVQRGRVDRVELPRHAAPRRVAPLRGGGRAARGTRRLMTRTIENGFELTGPISRGDWATVDAHVRAIHDEAPDLEAMYRVLAEARRREDRAHDRRAAGRAQSRVVGLVPTMGALHAGHASLFDAARDECDTVVATIFVRPRAVRGDRGLRALPAHEEQDARTAEEHGVSTSCSCPSTTSSTLAAFRRGSTSRSSAACSRERSAPATSAASRPSA